MYFDDSFQQRSVLVTGHTGFKGSWLAIWLNRLGARVSGLALPPTGATNHFHQSRVAELLAGHHVVDVRDFPAVERAIAVADPEVIFHLAAEPLVRKSYQEPRETFETNFMGTCNLLEAVRRRGRPCTVVVVTSDKCYANREQQAGYHEDDPMGGHDPYSASKGACELLVDSYRNSFFAPAHLERHGVKVASARAGNVIGGGDWATDRIVPDLVRCLTRGEVVPVRNPRAIRPWQHVLESLSGYLTLAARMQASDSPHWCGGWNFGPHPDDSASVRDLVESFCRAWGNGRWQDVSDPNQPHEACLLRLSIDKALAKLHWRPIWRFDETVSRTADWYRQFDANPAKSTYEACLRDISAYCEAANVRTVNPSQHLAQLSRSAA